MHHNPAGAAASARRLVSLSGWALCERFFAARRHGRRVICSVTSLSKQGSDAFHLRLAFAIEPQEHSIDGLPVCRDYHGRVGAGRVVFVRTLEG